MKLAVFNISEGTLRENRQRKLLTVRVPGYYSEYYVFCLSLNYYTAVFKYISTPYNYLNG